MNCSEFMARFSDLYDRDAECAEACELDGHLRACGRCRRYDKVVRDGVLLLRSLSDAELPEDFRPRLQHRIFHVDEEQALSRGSASGSGMTAATALAMAVLLVVVAWSPSLVGGETEVQLPAIVISEPEARPRPAPSPATLHIPRSSLDDRTLWQHTHSLLYEYSTLSERSRAALVRTGLD